MNEAYWPAVLNCTLGSPIDALLYKITYSIIRLLMCIFFFFHVADSLPLELKLRNTKVHQKHKAHLLQIKWKRFFYYLLLYIN